VISFTLLLSFHAPAQDLAKRLILKDGSFQLVTKYEVKGDRVRYLSAERNEWEELPNELVDWPATEKYGKDRSAGASVPEAVQLDKEIAADEEAEDAKLPQVAPGLRLPEASGVFLLDSYKGEPQVVELTQNAGDVNRNTKGNILRGALNPVASAKQTIILEGEHSAIQSHVAVPTLYINVEEGAENSGHPQDSTSNNSARSEPQGPQQPQQPQLPFDRYRILRTQVKGGKRILGDVKRSVTGKVSQDQQFVKTTASRVSGGWLKVTPVTNLAPGEYALVETMGKEGMNLFVWDFGVNPTAPPNPNPWKPDPAKRSQPNDTKLR
jgi:hypothetical protein